MEEIEQHWLYALSAPMAALNGASYTAATYFESYDEDETDLKKWWGINNRQELLNMLSMADTGHALELKDAYWQAARCLPSEWPQVLEALTPRKRIQYEFARRTLGDCGQGGVRAWDLGRMGYLLRAGLRKGYLSIDESLWLHSRLALRARHYYNGWDRYLAGYLFGKALWNCSSASDEELALSLDRQGSEHWNRCIMMNLSHDALGFFASIPWDLPLNPPERPDTLQGGWS